jgi:hypothetical protein
MCTRHIEVDRIDSDPSPAKRIAGVAPIAFITVNRVHPAAHKKKKGLKDVAFQSRTGCESPYASLALEDLYVASLTNLKSFVPL